MRRPLRALVGVAVGALALTACGVGSDEPSSDGSLDVLSMPTTGDAGEQPEPGAGAAEGAREDVPSALVNPAAAELPDPLIDVDRIVSGGPPPDGIPPIDDPQFDPADEVDWLDPQEPVLALQVDGEDRAYPVQIVIWHEIVNDSVAGVPVAVTYCPLCSSALAFDRRLTGPDGLDRVVSFGTSGKLFNSDLLMYDRQTESLWSQLIGTGVAGVLTGVELDRFPVQTVPFEAWRDQHPDGLVLNRDTGEQRRYGDNPYEGYDLETTRPFLFDGDSDDRLPPKRRVVGVVAPGSTTAVAVDHDLLRSEGVVSVSLGGSDLVAVLLPGAASALGPASIAEGDQVGATAVLDPVVGAERLTLETEGGVLRDAETGSTWTLDGRAISGPLEGSTMQVVPHSDPFWFAWAAFYPDTELVTE